MRNHVLIKSTYSLSITAEETRLLDATSDAEFKDFLDGIRAIPGVLEFEVCEEPEGDVFEYEVHESSIGQDGVAAVHAEIIKRLEAAIEKQRTAEQQAAPGAGR